MKNIPEFEHFTLPQMLEALKGICGRSFLLAHLKKTPVHDGKPTHRRIGNKIIFFPEDVEQLKASLAAPAEQHAGRGPAVKADPSEERQYQKALKLIGKIKADAKCKSRRTSRRQSTVRKEEGRDDKQ